MRGVGSVLVCLAGVGLVAVIWPRAHEVGSRAPRPPRSAQRAIGSVPATSPSSTESVHVPAWLAGSGAPRRIAGTVLAEGAPVPGASVQLASRVSEIVGIPFLQTTSDEEGHFDFGLQPRTGYTVSATDEGRARGLLHFESENLGFATDMLAIELPPCTAVSGIVSAKDGTPIAGARIGAGARAAVFAETDADGRFTTCLAGPSWPFVVVTARGYARKRVALSPNVVLDAAQPLAGQVVSREDKKPIADAVVAVLSDWEPMAWAVTSADGRFRFDDLGSPPGRIVVMTEDGMAAADRPKNDMKLEVGHERALEGVVLADDVPIAGVAVHEQWLPSWMWPRYSREDGSIRVPYLSVSDPFTRLVAEDPFVLVSPDVVDTTRPLAGLVIRVGAYGTIRGTVRRDGKPVAGVTVTCAGSHKVREKPLKSERDGSFVCDGLRAGTFQVSAEDETSGDATLDLSVDVKSGREEKVILDRWYNASVSGSVVTRSGKPVANARVGLRSAERDDDGVASTDAAGRFRVDQLVGRATYELQVARGSMPAVVSRVDVPDAFSHVEGLVITLDDPVPMGGRVVDASGAGLADVSVMVYRDGTSRFVEGVGTDASGRFTLHGPYGQTVRLQARARDGRRGVASLDDGTTDVTITVGD